MKTLAVHEGGPEQRDKRGGDMQNASPGRCNTVWRHPPFKISLSCFWRSGGHWRRIACTARGPRARPRMCALRLARGGGTGLRRRGWKDDARALRRGSGWWARVHRVRPGAGTHGRVGGRSGESGPGCWVRRGAARGRARRASGPSNLTDTAHKQASRSALLRLCPALAAAQKEEGGRERGRRGRGGSRAERRRVESDAEPLRSSRNGRRRSAFAPRAGEARTAARMSKERLSATSALARGAGARARACDESGTRARARPGSPQAVGGWGEPVVGAADVRQ
eukprot:349687-Chlamydomonas_euryale.AAC.2